MEKESALEWESGLEGLDGDSGLEWESALESVSAWELAWELALVSEWESALV